MTDGSNSGWRDYRPSKVTWFWSCVGCVIATMVIGFTWGGWVTGGSADQMAAEAREAGRAQLAATICVARYIDAPDAAVQLAALKDESEQLRTRLADLAGRISERRTAGALILARRVTDELTTLAMPHARIEIGDNRNSSLWRASTTIRSSREELHQGVASGWQR